MKTIHEVYVLKNGVKMPKVGFGTWQVKSGDEAYQSVQMALKHGYIHIDTAAAYRNEASVGQAIKDSGLKREDIFVTSKLQSHIKSYQETLDAFDQTLKELGFDYLDLYLIHAPWPWNEIGKNCDEGNVQAWKAMEKLYRDGRVRAIGVSNFSPKDIENILKHCEIIPHVNQIAYFIGNNQEETQAYCDTKGILIEAYSPLAIGYALSNPEIVKMAEKYQVTAAQLCIRYCIDKGTAPLPKSIHESRIIENTGLEFVIQPNDLKYLDSIKNDPRRWN
ncbi:MAG: aldo/keto reductase [Acholeplasma sp.]|jgi:diketogulonate reductase-like aldo/keto reductase|nr:MAG: aldo/keto reductase [Acholeplasma sp.]